MRRQLFLLPLLLVALCGLLVTRASGQSSSWPNEPTGATVISDWNWNSCTGAGWSPANGCGTIKSDVTAPLSPPSVLSYQWIPSTGFGAGDPYLPLNSATNVYVGFWAWMDPNFYGTASQLNKIIAVFFNNNDSFWLEAASGVSPGGPFYPQWSLSSNFGLNNCHLPAGYGDCPGTYLLPGQSNPTITKGVWHRFEFYLQKSTNSTSQDGIVRWWMDGAQLGDYTNVNYSDVFQFVSVTPAWAGSPEPGWTHPSEWRFDHIHVSVGGTPGGGGGGSDTTPPPDIPSLSAQGLSETSIGLTWTGVVDSGGSGLQAYEIEHSPGSSCTNFVPLAETTFTNYTHAGLTLGTTHCYRVRARDGAGNRGGYSPTASAVTSSTTRTTSASDDFNRADNTDLGANWEDSYGSHTNLQIVNNEVRAVSTTGPESYETYTGTTLPDDQWNQATIRINAGSTEQYFRLAVRMSAPATVNNYECRVDLVGGVHTSRISRKDNNSPNHLTSRTDITWDTGDIARCEAQGQTITFYRNGVSILNASDGTYASGRVGLYLWDDTDLANLRWDDWSAGTWGASPDPVLPAPSNPIATLIPGSPPQMRITWGSVVGAANYKLHVHAEGTSYEPCSSMVFCDFVTANEKTVTIAYDTLYDFWVVPYTSGGTPGNSSGNVAFFQAPPPSTQPPIPPTNPKQTLYSIQPLRVRLSWSPTSGVTEYLVEVWPKGMADGPCGSITYCQIVTETRAVVDVAFASTYNWRVVALQNGIKSDPLTQSFGTPLSLADVRLTPALVKIMVEAASDTCLQLAACTVTDLATFLKNNMVGLPE